MILIYSLPSKTFKGLVFCGLVLLSGMAYHLSSGIRPSTKLLP